MPAPRRRREPQRPARFDALDVHDLSTLQDGQMPGLAGVPDEPLEERQGLVPEVEPLRDQPAELEQAPPEAVLAGARRALDEAQMLEVHQEAVGGRLVQAQPLGQIAETQFRLVCSECTEDGGGPLEGLDPVLRLERILGLR